MSDQPLCLDELEFKSKHGKSCLRPLVFLLAACVAAQQSALLVRTDLCRGSRLFVSFGLEVRARYSISPQGCSLFQVGIVCFVIRLMYLWLLSTTPKASAEQHLASFMLLTDISPCPHCFCHWQHRCDAGKPTDAYLLL